jgi:hypothetical protein
MTRSSLRLADEATVLHEDETGIELASTIRLSPGRWVELRDDGTASRKALVWSWRIVGVGSNGPQYRGWCRWDGADGESSTPAARIRNR